eukprot:SAG31_NODE_3089_length_4688_cov_4.310961_5_plen_305_part_00
MRPLSSVCPGQGPEQTEKPQRGVAAAPIGSSATMPALLLLVLLAVAQPATSQTIHIPYNAGSVQVVGGGEIRPGPIETGPDGRLRPSSYAAQESPALGDAWSVSVAIPDGFAGVYSLSVEAQTGPDLGITAISLNGSLVATLDCFALHEQERAGQWKNFSTEGIELAVGSHVVHGAVVAKNPQATEFGFHARAIRLTLTERPVTKPEETATSTRRQLDESNSTSGSESNISSSGGGYGPVNGRFRACRRVQTQLFIEREILVGPSPLPRIVVSVPNVKGCDSLPLNEQRPEWQDVFQVRELTAR